MALIFWVDSTGELSKTFQSDGRIFHGEIWLALTYAFFHGSSFHLLGNLFTLLVYGCFVARYYPMRWWLGGGLLCTIVAGVAVPAFSGGAVIGASAFTYALNVMFLTALVRARVKRIDDPLGFPLIIVGFLVLATLGDFVSGLMDPQVSVLAHFVGISGGLLTGCLAPIMTEPATDPR
jgi:membrane associated rhomboid family serine protease